MQTLLNKDLASYFFYYCFFFFHMGMSFRPIKISLIIKDFISSRCLLHESNNDLRGLPFPPQNIHYTIGK